MRFERPDYIIRRAEQMRWVAKEAYATALEHKWLFYGRPDFYETAVRQDLGNLYATVNLEQALGDAFGFDFTTFDVFDTVGRKRKKKRPDIARLFENVGEKTGYIYFVEKQHFDVNHLNGQFIALKKRIPIMDCMAINYLP